MNAPLLEGLLSRYSLGIKYLAEPGPDDAQLRTMVAAALHAPDHERLVPYRFVAVRGAARERLAQLFMQSARSAGKPDAAVAVDGDRARRAPVTLALVARIDMGHPVVPAHEQWCAVGGALANFMNALHALGYAGKMLSGAKVRDAAIQAAFCEPGETLVGWIAIGTATREIAPAGDKPAPEAVLREWPA
jgi:nitroreductase